MVDVFIVGSKGIPAQYGGYETFVDKLTENRCNMDIKYHVACKVRRDDHSVKRFSYNHADCFNVTVPKIGAAEAIYYDLAAINESIAYIKKIK
ncbi:rhamnosyltransferase [Lacticaseibacillus paracasei subsp. paracasei Lpp221]|nr:rhamnosyltransferase [Lacticaseibacillus paracasei subsp. paracasei Lpp221]